MALSNCRECGNQVSSEAVACPHCGAKAAPAAKTGPSAGAIIAMLFVAGLMLLAAISSSTNRDVVVAELLPKQQQCRENVSKLQTLGVRFNRSAGLTIAQYDEIIWARLDHDDKVRQALLIFCADAPQSGAHSVMIKGLKSGKNLAGVTNGSYVDF